MPLNPQNVTGYSGAWDTQYNAPYKGGIYQRDSFERSLSRLLALPGYRRKGAIMRALNGVAPGAAYSVTQTRIAQAMNDAAFGGVRNTESIVQSGTTTVAQRDEINARIYDDVLRVTLPSAYPVDTSGNGGAGKVGF